MTASHHSASSPKSSRSTDYVNDTNPVFGYVSGLDGLRFAAVLIVIFAHYKMVPYLPGGFGVSLFFFISGFLISRLLLAEENKKGKIGLVDFYIRRFLRLAPPLLLMGLICVPTLRALYPDSFSWTQVIMAFLYLGNFSGSANILLGWPEGLPSLEPLWSLAIEEHFYLILAPLFVLARSNKVRYILIFTALTIPLILRLAVYATLDAPLADEINYHVTFMRLDSMAWGVMMTLLLKDGYIKIEYLNRYGYVLLIGGLVAVLMSMVHWTEIYEIAVKYTPQMIAIGILLAGVIFSGKLSWVRAILEFAPIRHMGRISYELYLWHYPIFAIVAYFQSSWIMTVVIAFPLTFLTSHVAYRLVTDNLRQARVKFGGHNPNKS